MGATALFKVVDGELCIALNQGLAQIEDILFPEGVDNPFADQVDLDKNWHMLHYLFSNDTEVNDEILSHAILGGKETGSDLGYGPARLISPEEVKTIAKALEGIDVIQRYDRIDTGDLLLSNLYRSFEFCNGEKEELALLAVELKSMYTEASNNDNAVIAYFA